MTKHALQTLAIFVAFVAVFVEAQSTLECGFERPCEAGFVCQQIATSPLKKCVARCDDTTNPCSQGYVCERGMCKTPSRSINKLVLAVAIPLTCIFCCFIPLFIAKCPCRGKDITPSADHVKTIEIIDFALQGKDKKGLHADFIMDIPALHRM
eukprot:2286253-Rhodomonas_salina.2